MNALTWDSTGFQYNGDDMALDAAATAADWVKNSEGDLKAAAEELRTAVDLMDDEAARDLIRECVVRFIGDALHTNRAIEHLARCFGGVIEGLVVGEYKAKDFQIWKEKD